MYCPIIKNKLNEIKGLRQAIKQTSLIQVKPIIELVGTKNQDINDFLNLLLDDTKVNGISDILKNTECFIDIPTYFPNQIFNDLSLTDHQVKYNFFLELSSKVKEAGCNDITPVISFDYSHETKMDSIRQNRVFARKIMQSFDNFAIRLFSSDLFKKEDLDIFWELYDFLPDKIEKATLIIEVSSSSIDYVIKNIEEITTQSNIKNIILAGESFADSQKFDTELGYTRSKNIHLLNFNKIKKRFSNTSFNYADFTITDKIQSSIDIDSEKGFLYYPFIKYTTEDGNLCTFTASNRGNYEQYGELCKKIIEQVRNFSVSHCDTCDFINSIASKSINDGFKAGSVWKYRMIAHYITTMRNLINTVC
ncbi:beta family protein [Campylobacter sp. 7477a]|uniref:beta family protein n=1 Tax=Campylobacter sp. 7477a TaxID=2735741 RepID=UPI0030150AD0|nr:hypothetical protein [Campylobacter sp. 7477a]